MSGITIYPGGQLASAAPFVGPPSLSPALAPAAGNHSQVKSYFTTNSTNFVAQVKLEPGLEHAGRDNKKNKKPHIKKPLNAFMLYMKEMRPKVGFTKQIAWFHCVEGGGGVHAQGKRGHQPDPRQKGDQLNTEPTIVL